MAITLAPVGLSDAEVTDGIGRGDVECATRLWVRFWPTALSGARRYVERAEVPGLAAEALIGTIAATAIGRGPREDVAGFVTEAVHELGGEEPLDEPAASSGLQVYTSALMTRAFSGLSEATQDVLRSVIEDARYDEDTVEALTQLQRSYLAAAVGRAATQTCRQSLTALAVSVEASSAGLSAETWLHLSTCAWCTESFHELAFSNVALGALIDPSLVARPAVVDAAAPPLFADEVAAAPVVVAAPLPEPEPAPVALHPAALHPVVAEPLAAAVEEAEELEHPHRGAVAPLALLRGRRGRLAAVAAAALAATAVVVSVVVAAQGDSDPRPAAADAPASENGGAAPTDTTTSVPGALLSPAAARSDLPTTIVAPPEATPTGKQTKAADKPTTSPSTHAPRPTTQPSSDPAPTSDPTPTAPPVDPTPTPTPTPTPHCSFLDKLFGRC